MENNKKLTIDDIGMTSENETLSIEKIVPIPLGLFIVRSSKVNLDPVV